MTDGGNHMMKPGYIEKDGYLFGKILQHSGALKDAIYFSDRISSDDVMYINENLISKIILDFTTGGTIDLSILDDLKCLEYLDIYGIIDATLLPPISRLKLLRVHSKSLIELVKFPNLEVISTNTPNQLIGIDKLKKIKSVTIIGRSEPCSQKVLDEVGAIRTIDTLNIQRSVMRDLSFLRNVPNLQVLILMQNARLLNIDSLESSTKALTCLKIIRSSKIESFSRLSSLPSLEYLYIDTCNKISDLSFIYDLPKLRAAVFAQTNILDGNLTPLMKLDYGVAIPIKSHYYAIRNKVHEHVKLGQFPLTEASHGDENIESWRRIDTW